MTEKERDCLRLSLHLALLALILLIGLFASPVMIRSGHWLPAAMTIAYFSLIVIAAVLGLPRLWRFVRTMDDSREGEARLAAWTAKLLASTPTIEELSRERKFASGWVGEAIDWIRIVYLLPILLLHLTIGARGGIRFLWRIPVGFYELWYGVTLLLCFVAAISQPVAACWVAAVLWIFKVREVLTVFDIQEGQLRLFTVPRHKIGLRSIAVDALFIGISAACVHRCLSILDPAAYSRKLDAVDSLYYSIVTLATVGYGDIVPLSTSAKIAAVCEIITGVFVLVFAVTVNISAWMRVSSPEVLRQEPITLSETEARN